MIFEGGNLDVVFYWGFSHVWEFFGEAEIKTRVIVRNEANGTLSMIYVLCAGASFLAMTREDIIELSN
ncbi:hypothetical protein DN068_05715 [Taibaiella soli]|uniref:Uncharacterized protein n=1 Tax=Taibaiella soli TaxID=1649169 RepID=A0A2W2ANC6_9BACT|nr:hypothetical protein DN068_05715 [Taibaiella soli]